MVVENEPFPFTITHVEAEGQLLKIWAQTDDRIVQSVATILLNLQAKFDYGESHIPAPPCIVPNTRCCARGINNEFCRVNILGQRSDGLVIIQFVDYGNISCVPISNIRLLDRIPEANYLFSLPEAATPFILADVVPIGGSWLDEVIKNIRSILVNKKLFGIYQNVNNYKAIKFTLMEQDFGQMLINRNMALYRPSSAKMQLTQSVPVQCTTAPHHTGVAIQENWRMPVSQNIPPVQKIVQKSNSFKAIQLPIGSVHDVQVSYVEEGPTKFSVQLIESIPALNNMMQQINSQSHQPLQEPPIAGTVCLGRQEHLNRLCRVVLNSPGDTSCKVYYADYGHHEILSFNSIYQIPDEFRIPNIFSIRFTLSGIMNWNVTPEMKDYFAGLVLNKHLKLRVCKGPMSPLTQYCDLFLNGQDVKEILYNAFEDLCNFNYPEPKSLEIGAKEAVYISHVDSIAKFFVILENELKITDEIQEIVGQASQSAATLNPSQIRPEMPCLALYDLDKSWYRASVLRLFDNNTVEVFYVDFGNVEIVSTNHLKAIPLNLVQMFPRKAIKCSISGYNTYSDDNLNKDFKAVVLEEHLNLVVLNVISDTLIVSLYEKEIQVGRPGLDITEKLKSLEISKNPESVAIPDRNNKRITESVKSPQVRNPNDSWSGNWEKEAQGQSNRANNYDSYDKSKFRKDNENEQRSDNRFRKNGSDYPNGSKTFDKGAMKPDRFVQNERFGKSNEVSGNDRFNRGSPRNGYDSNDFNSTRPSKENQGNRSSVNSRLDRSFGSGSDKDSDTSSRGSARRNRDERRANGDQRRRDGPSNNQNRIGRWENDERGQDSHHKNYNGTVDSTYTKPKPSGEIISNSVHSQSENWDSTLQGSILNNTDTSRYLTSTPISTIPPPNITVGAIKYCIIVYYVDPEDFYVQLYPDNEELNSIMDKIDTIYKDGGKIIQPSNLKPHLQCIAQYSMDERWYRAVINSVENSTATVHFIDYGNVETVRFDKIKAIDSELLKLPAQAIHCKLFCPGKSNWSKEEADKLSDITFEKELEANFVIEEKGVYQILIKDTQADSKSPKYINDLFANGLDLIKAKDNLRNKNKSTVVNKKSDLPDYASLNEKWLESTVELGKTYKVQMGWFINPESFYCQLENQQEEFRNMMNEIQTVYVKRQPVSEPLKVGSSIIAILPDDGVLYRAEVLELNKPRGHVIQYVDYGDRAMVDPQKVYPVERKYMTLPRQAIHCGLKNIAPAGGSNWTASAEMTKYFSLDNFECIFHEFKNDKYLISLKSDNTDIASALVEKNLAVFSSAPAEEMTNGLPEDNVEMQEVPRIDINLLEGQTLRVKVSSVEGVGKFYVQFNTAETCQASVDTYMEKKDSKMLGLPGQLSVMQNQAIECGLFDVPLSTKANETLKRIVAGKDVKIFVEAVERNRLAVRLFDTNGNKIKVVDTQNTERISPICNMPILSSTHEVVATWINSSNSIWLQRTADAGISQQLLDALYDFYSITDKSILPEVDVIYAGLSADGNWYRVKVMQVKETAATVILIDFGNIEDIPTANLRALEAQFYEPHQLAIDVSLTVTLSGDETHQLSILEPLLQEKTFTATLYNVNRKWVAELCENGEKLSDKLSSLNVVKETTKMQFESAELPEMIVGEKYGVFVSHVDTPHQLWIQRSEEADAINELQAQLQEASSLYPNCDGIPEEKSLWLAIYTLDNQWYRAEVLDADADITTVRFIDYGNTDVIHNNAGHLKQLPEKWKAIKKYAIQCKLDILPVNHDDWSEEACARLNELAPSVEQALVIADKAPMRVDLFVGDQSVCKTLIEKNLAMAVQGSEELEGEELAEEVVLDPQSAFTSNIVSVDQFWMQEDKWVGELEMMEDRLVMGSMFPEIKKVAEGQLCIAHFPYDDGYYRASVLSQSEDGTMVRYIDYGNAALTKDLREIPEDLVKMRPLSRKCRLAKPDGVEQWPAGINDEFKALAANGATIFLLDVIEEGETCLVRLTLDGRDVAAELVNKCSKAAHPDDEGIGVEELKDIATEERLSPIGEETTDAEDVIVCDVNAPYEFWIHKKSQLFALEDLMAKLRNADSFAPVSEVREGMILASQFDEDRTWYRSKVLSHAVNGTKVLHIDFGFTATTETDADLRELPEELARLRAFATRCSLKLPEGLENWPENSYIKFIDLTSDRAEFRLEVLDKSHQLDSEHPLMVRLFSAGEDVVDILLRGENVPHTGKPLNDQVLGEELKEQMDKNLSDDSAIHSEVEQQATPTNIVTNTTHNQYIMETVTSSVEITCETKQLKNVNLQEPSANSKPLEQNGPVKDPVPTRTTEAAKTVPELRTPDMRSRIAQSSPIQRCSSPEDKIVPGSINKGEVFANALINVTEEFYPITTEDEDLEIQNFNEPAINRKDAAATAEEIDEIMNRPTTPKIDFEEKLVAGAVNAQMALVYEEEEVVAAHNTN